MIKKNLGGDRLGSGKKMQVELHGYERSTFDLSYLFRSTMSPGTLVPFLKEVALPGDTFDIDLDCDIKTHPTVGPLFGSYKVQLDVFQIPIRLFNSLLNHNRLGIGNKMQNAFLPVMRLYPTPVTDAVDLDNAQVNPSSLLAYLDIRGVGISAESTGRNFNAVPMLAYWEIYKNYYANKQEEIGAFIHTDISELVETVTNIEINNVAVVASPLTSNYVIFPGDVIEVAYTGASPLADQIYFNSNRGALTLSQIAGFSSAAGGVLTFTANAQTTGLVITNWRYRTSTDVVIGAPTVATFPLENIDTMRRLLDINSNESSAVEITSIGSGISPYNLINNFPQVDYPNALASQELLALKTYQSDLFNNWIATEWLDGSTGINQITAIDVSGGKLQIDSFIFARKVYDMLMRIAVSGGSYDDYLEAAYGHEQYRKAQTPMYMGGLSKELVFQEVVSNAAADGQDLGTLAGKGVMAKKHKGGKINIKVDEPSYIMGLVSLTPRVDYSQGNKWDTGLQTLADLHRPGMDEIGFQDSINEARAWWDTRYNGTEWVKTSAGKVPAWINYMTNVNVVRGNFAIADNEMFMTLNRRYEYNPGVGILDLTTYIDPVKFNHIFADTAIDAQNFWAQIAVDMIVRRKMSSKVMPNL